MVIEYRLISQSLDSVVSDKANNSISNTQRLSLNVLTIKYASSLIITFMSAITCTAQLHTSTVDTSNPLHQKTRTVILKDTDHDGVTDEFDKEPNTPAGCPVDTHGVQVDTDGDGVPDCRDKEKLSRADCFPVDSNGVATCPEVNCCYAGILDYFGCSSPDFPSFQFKSEQKTIQKEEPLLDSMARDMIDNPTCKITLQGYYTANNRSSYQLTNTRIQTIIKYLTDKWEISAERLSKNIKAGTYINSVNIIHN